MTREFSDLIGKVTTQGDVQVIYKRFGRWINIKLEFERELGGEGSSMHTCRKRRLMCLFSLEAFYYACESLRKNGTAVPNVRLINCIHNAGYEIRPPNLISTDEELKPIEVPDEAPSFDHQAREIIGASLQQSEQLLSEGRDRQAVQELLWLLETVSTAFHGLDMHTGTVQGKYFNKIVEDLRRGTPRTTVNEVLDWIDEVTRISVVHEGRRNSPRCRSGDRRGDEVPRGSSVLQSDPQLYCFLNSRTRAPNGQQ